MAKGNPFGNIPGMGNMMKQVQQMMADQQKIEQELRDQRIEAASGGGMVTAVANGLGEIFEIRIDPQVVDPEDVEMLQDLVVSAVREALQKGQEIKDARLQALTGGLNLPPGMF
jgi:nucleoid-associated protein EbfC